ncbi:MAG: nitroreductase family protein [Chloroflexi bacterium]|nr:nitroreductase family protein [Chloroflexota bacterium]
MDVHEAIRTKRAIRNFADQPVPDDAIRAVLNAGRRAQSSKNTQPWVFIAIRDRDSLKKLSECGKYAGHLAGAAFAVAIVSPSADTDFDLGQAAAYMQLAAWELGIGSCIAYLHKQEKAKAVLGLPPEMHFHTAISFGYPAPEQRRPEVVRKGGRRPFEEVVRWERW